MGSGLRGLLFAAFQNRLSTLGHVLNSAEIYMLVDDAETAIATDASAQTDSQSDNVGSPDPSQEQGS